MYRRGALVSNVTSGSIDDGTFSESTGDRGSDSFDMDAAAADVGECTPSTSANAPPTSGSVKRDENEINESCFFPVFRETYTGGVAEGFILSQDPFQGRP